jgi:hypothetical protein
MGIEAGAGALKTSVSVIIRAQIAPLATSIWGGSFTQARRTPANPYIRERFRAENELNLRSHNRERSSCSRPTAEPLLSPANLR